MPISWRGCAGCSAPTRDLDHLDQRAKGDPAKLALAARLRRETTLTIRQIAERLRLGSWQSLNNKLYLLRQAKHERSK